MDLSKYVRESLREIVLGSDVLVEAKSVGDWWEHLPGKRRTKVIEILGMNKGKDKKIFDKLDADEQAEISAYYKKHKGKVEGVEGVAEDRRVSEAISAVGEWTDILEKGDNALSRLSGAIRQAGVGSKEFKVLRDRYKGLGYMSAKLMHVLSSKANEEREGLDGAV